MKEVKIGKSKIGSGNKVFIIAELSANHNQDYDLAVKSIKAMKEAGADAVKVQTYTADTITLDSDKKYFQVNQGTIWDGVTLHQLYKQAYTPWEWQPKLKKVAEDLGLVFFSTPFDFSSVDFLEKMNVPCYKIASFEINDIPLIEYVAKKGKPIIMSTGVSELADIEEAIKTCRKAGNDDIMILKCTSAYPTPLEELNLKTIPDIKERFKVVSGISDHTMGATVSIAATALGASIVEKHFILDRKIGGPDASFSMDPKEFKEMVQAIRDTEKALGRVNYDLTPKAKKSREHSRSLFIAEDIKKGEVFTEKNLRSVRPAFGLHTRFYYDILGKKSKQDLEKGEPMKKEYYK